MKMDGREEQENADDSILRNNEQIPLKQMKGIHNQRNTLNW
jgi:hypothetical protein